MESRGLIILASLGVFRSRLQAYCLETLITANILLRKTSAFHRVFCLLYLKVKNNNSRWE